MLLQAAWILTVPPFRGIDEFDHAYRASGVAGGQWVADEPADNGRGNLVRVPPALVEAAHDQCARLEYTGVDNCSPVEQAGDGQVLVASAAAAYHPAFYWIVGTAARPFDGAGALYAMRVGTAALSLVFLAMAAWALGKLPSRWPMVGLVLATTPVLVYSTTVVSPNGVEMCAGIALWAGLLGLARSQPAVPFRQMYWIIVSSAVALGTLRILGPLFVVLIVATVLLLNGKELLAAARAHRREVVFGGVLVAASAVGQIAWMYDTVSSEMSSEVPDSPAVFNPVNIIVWPLQAIAAFPLRDQAGATIIYPVVLLMFVGLVTLAWRRGNRRERASVGASLLVAYGLPFAFTATTLSSLGAVWQGRYGLPYSVGVVLVAATVISGRHGATRPSGRVLVPMAMAYGFAICACLLKIRHDELPFSEASRSGAWVPAPILIVALTAAAGALMVAYFLHSRREALARPRDLGTESVPEQGPNGSPVGSADRLRD